MARRTGYQSGPLAKDSLAGTDEVTLVAHDNETAVGIGTEIYSERELAQALVDAGWQGGSLRLAACKTGVCGPSGTAYGQNLANELGALGAESVVIAPTASVSISGGETGLPQVLRPVPPGGEKSLLPPGRGWEIFMAEEPSRWQFDKAVLRPGAWKGSAVGAAKTGAFILLSIIHARAVARRVEEERNKTGYAPYGPTGNRAYDLDAWILDLTDEAGRSIELSQRFTMAKWRSTIREIANSRKRGEYYGGPWQTFDGYDDLGSRKLKQFW
jgi:hypothetical protein